MQHATGKMQQTTRSVQQTTYRQTCGTQRAMCSEQQTICTAHENRQHAPDFKQHAADNNDMQRNIQHAACNGRRAPCNTQRGIRKRPLTTRNKATGNMRHGADTAKNTAKPRAHARCNRKRTAPPHFVCGEQGAADKQQSIVLDNQCATRHRRHTQDAPHDRCRSMQQAHAEPTARSRH